MSRLFANTAGDHIDIDPSASVPANQGSFTVMALVKMVATLATDQWVIQAYNASNGPAWGFLCSGGKFYNEGNFGPGNGTMVLDAWMWVGFSKASGSVAPRWHFHNLTAATAWSHVNDASNVGDGSGPPVKIVIGGRQAGTSSWKGNIAAIAVWDQVLSDTVIENASVSANALSGSNPKWGVLLNQSSTATPVTDLSGLGATQSAIAGTTVSADEPPSWDYAIGPTGPTLTVWDGTAEVAATISIWNGTSEVAASLSDIA